MTDDVVVDVGVTPPPDRVPNLHCLTATASTPRCAVVSGSMAAMLDAVSAK